MTSVFEPLDISLIITNRAYRQRKELTGLDTLATSIANIGLINPITVDENNTLIAGERRLTACRDILGWTAIMVQRLSDLSEEEQCLLELEENIKREELSWSDHTLALQRFHKLQTGLHEGDWSLTKTAEILSITPSALSSRLSVAAELSKGTPNVVNADKFSTAKNIVARTAQRRRDDAVQELNTTLTTSSAPMALTSELISEETSLLSEKASSLTLEEIIPAHPFIHKDFHEWQKTYSGDKFNFIHCDFPYGINADKHDQNSADVMGSYEDTEDVYWDLLNTLEKSMDNVVASSAHMIFWFSMDKYAETYHRLFAMGWHVNKFPCVWMKSDSKGVLPDHRRQFRRTVETFFLCSRGDRFLVKPVSNGFCGPKPVGIHMSQKSTAMLEYFFQALIDEGTTMLDPTMGSGAAVKVAETMNARLVLGLEKSEEFYDRAVNAYLGEAQ